MVNVVAMSLCADKEKGPVNKYKRLYTHRDICIQ